MEYKKYKIDSFEKLLNTVNTENAQGLATDLALWVIDYARVLENIRKKSPKKCKGKTNWELVNAEFHWIDDGVIGINGWEVIDKKTGEIKYIDYPKKED